MNPFNGVVRHMGHFPLFFFTETTHGSQKWLPQQAVRYGSDRMLKQIGQLNSSEGDSTKETCSLIDGLLSAIRACEYTSQ